MFKHMHLYTVHHKAGRSLEQEPPVFVREGFSVMAFLFTVFWALYHRLWLVALCLMAYIGVVTQAEIHGYITEGSSLALLLGGYVFLGFQANDWLRAKLKRRGYVTAGIASGDSLIRAQQRFFDHHAAA